MEAARSLANPPEVEEQPRCEVLVQQRLPPLLQERSLGPPGPGGMVGQRRVQPQERREVVGLRRRCMPEGPPEARSVCSAELGGGPSSNASATAACPSAGSSPNTARARMSSWEEDTDR